MTSTSNRVSASDIGKLHFISGSAPIMKSFHATGIPRVYATSNGSSTLETEEDGALSLYIPEFPPVLDPAHPLSEFSKVITTGQQPVPTVETIVRALYTNGFKLKGGCDSYIFRAEDAVGNCIILRVFHQKGISGEGGKTENVLRIVALPLYQKPKCPPDLEAKVWKDIETRLTE